MTELHIFILIEVMRTDNDSDKIDVITGTNGITVQ